MSLFKTNLTATDLNVTNLTVTTLPNTNGIFATNSQAVNTSVNNKIVSPGALKYLLQNPANIGTTNSAPASFTSLTCNSVTGACVANDSESIAFGQIQKVVTPYQMQNILKSPPVIGSGIANSAVFTSIKASSISGCIANQNQLTDPTVKTKVLTPLTVNTILQNPPTIGETSQNSAKFTTLNVKGGFSVGQPIDATKGGTGFSSFTKGDLLIGTGGSSNTLVKLPVGTDGEYLQTDSSATYGIKWGAFSTGSQLSSGTTQVNPASNTDAINYNINNQSLVPSNMPTVFTNLPTIGDIVPNTGTFTNVTANSISSSNAIPVSKGGLGINSFKKGDLLVGNTSGTLSKLSAGIDGQMLSIDNLGNPRWVDTPSATTAQGVVLPFGYCSFSNPYVNSGLSYVIDSMKVKNYEGSVIANKSNLTFDLSSQNVIPVSANLSGTVSTSTTTVTGAGTTFNSDFVVGDIITIGGVSRRIVSITSNTSLEIASALASEASSTTYLRGGLCDNTMYFAYMGATSMFFSTRDSSNSQSILDIPGGASISQFYQVSLKLAVDTASPLKVKFVNTSSDYPDKYVIAHEPTYTSATSYEIKSSSCRDNNDSANIDVPVSQTVSISKFGQNGLEKEFQLSGSISTSGNIITGTGTSFLSQLAVGDSVGLSGSTKTAKIVSINSDTSLTLDGSIDTGGSVTWTINGLCTVSTTQYKFGSKSMYMTNGSTLNYLRPSGLPYNSPSTWTLEAWVYPTANQKSIIFGSYNGYGLEAYISLSQMGLNILFEGYRNDVSITGSTTFTLATWNHVAWSYDGTTYRMFRNGTLVGSGTNGPVKNGFFSDMIIGSTFPYGTPRIYDANGIVTLANKYVAVTGTGNAFNGYIDDIRFSNNCRYNNTFTAPSVAFTSDANTIFLQNFEITNGIAITSNLLSALDSVNTNTYTITGPVVLNPNSKFGSSCLEFISEGSSNVTFTTYPSASSAWTIECWFKLKSYTSVNPIIGQNTANLFGVYVDQFGTINYCLSSNGTSFNLLNVKKTGVQLNTWYHMALVFTGSQYLVFLNGYLVGSSTTSTAISASCWTSTFGLGLYNGSYYDGYIDEFRFSTSARYSLPVGVSLQDDVNGINWIPNGSYVSTSTGKFAQSLNVSSNNGYSTTIPYTISINNTSPPAVLYSSTLSAWFDASDSSTVTTSGSNLVQINDKTGNGYHCSLSSVGSNSPTYSTVINGRNTITFSANGKFLTCSGPGTLAAFTAMFIVRVNGAPSGVVNNFFSTDGSWVTGSTHAGVRNTMYPQYVVNSGSDYIASSALSTGTLYLITYIDTNINSTMYINGTSAGTTTNFSSITSRLLSTLNIFGWSGDNTRTVNGDLGEFLLFNNVLTSTARASAENYLMYKWGITGTAYSTPINTNTSPYLSSISSFPRNLMVWYDPTDASTVTYSSGSNVSTILDKSGNSNTATIYSTSPTVPPTITQMSGKNALTFGTGGSNQQIMQTQMGYVKSYTAFIVFNMISNIGTYCMFTSLGGWTSNASVNIGYSTGGIGITTPVDSVDTNVNPTLGTTYLLTIVDTGTQATMYLNGTSIGTKSMSSAMRNLSLGIGGWTGGPSRNTNTKYGDIQFYQGTMSTSNRQAIENYFMYKWGIVGTVYDVPISWVSSFYPWSLECWFYPTTTGISNSIIGNSGSTNVLNMAVTSNNAINVQISSTGTTFDLVDYTSSNGIISGNTWYHIAISYDTTNFYVFLNGQLLTTVNSAIGIANSIFSGGILNIGKFKTNSFTGYIDEFRISKVARYTSAFTPATTPFTVDANTLSLVHGNGFYGQGQYYNLLANDDAASFSVWSGITSPVLTSSVYKFGSSSANVSLGAGLSLSTQFYPYTYNITYTNSASFPSGLICWYDPSDATSVTLSGSNVTQIANKVSGGGFNLTPSSTGATTVTYNTAAINGFNTVTMSLNGKYLTNTSSLGNMPTFSYFGIVNYTTYVANKFLLSNDSINVVFGSHPSSAVPYYKTSAGSTSNTSMNLVPTIGSTVLLSMVDYGTYVNVYMNGILIANEPIGYTTNKMFNTLCIGGNVVNSANYTINGKLGEIQLYNKAVSDTERKQIEYYLMNKWGLTPNSSLNANSSSAWTMECWFNCNQLGMTNTILNNSYASNASLINVSITSTNNVNCKIGSDGYSYDIMDITSSSTINQNTWYHIAVVYDSSTGKYTAYLNGTSFGSKTSSKLVNIATFSKYLYVGSSFSGYIDEFRLSNSARYSTSFTPSSTEFTSDANTISLQHFNTMLSQDATYNLSAGQYSSDGTTSYLNHFDLDQNINSSELTLSPVTGQSLYYRSLLANTIYYLYVSGGNTPYYMLSTKCYVKNGVVPNGLSSTFRQLPYVFITDGSKNLYQINWEGNYGIIINSPIMTANSVSQDWNGSGYLSSHDVSALVPKISSLGMVRLKNIGSSTASLNVRDTIFNAYSNVPVYSIPINTEATYYCPISSDQKFFLDRGSNQSFEYQISGFYINDM